MKRISQREAGALQRTRPKLFRMIFCKEITTPLLAEMFGTQITVKYQISNKGEKLVRSYSLITAHGEILEMGTVYSVNNSSNWLLEVQEPLGLWALKNGYTSSKKRFLNGIAQGLRDREHCVFRAIPGRPVIGRRYKWILTKHREKHELIVREFWNPQFF